MLGLFKKKMKMFAIDSGEIIEIQDVPDQVFSQKLVGDGYGIIPKTGVIKSPIDGEIVHVFPTGHAVGIKSTEGIEILIHIGLDTVELKGNGFEIKAEKGQKISAGEVLVNVDLDYLKEQGKSIVTPIIFTNKADYERFEIKYENVNDNDLVGYVYY